MRVEGQAAAARPDVSALLTASAGSGKTRALIARVLHLLAAGASPDEIAAITFTEKAAAQMKEKLHGFLAQAAWEGTPLAGALGIEAGDMPYPLVKSAEEIFSELMRPDSLRMSTIHAFCLGLLRRSPLEAGLPAQFFVMDDSDAPIRREAAVEACFSALHDEGATGDLDTLAAAGINLRGLKTLLIAALSTRGQLSRLETDLGGLGALVRETADTADGWLEKNGGELGELSARMAALIGEYGFFEEDVEAAFTKLARPGVPDEFTDAFLALKPHFYNRKGELRKSPLTKGKAVELAGKSGAAKLMEEHDRLYLRVR